MENRPSTQSNGKLSIADDLKFIAKKSKPKTEDIIFIIWEFLTVLIHFFTYVFIGYMYYFYSTNSSSISNCIMDGFQNASQLHDPVYRSQVTENCWTYGIYPDNYMEYTANRSTIYLSKHTKSDRRPIEFYERQHDEVEYLRKKDCLLLGNGGMQVALLLLWLFFGLARLPLAWNIVAILQLISLAHLAAVLKLLIYGQYSVEHGLRFESLFSFPLDQMRIETISSEIAHSKTFIPQDVKFLDSELFCPGLRKFLSVFITYFLAFLAFTHLVVLVRMIVLKIRAAKHPKNTTTTSRLNSGKDGKPADKTTTKSTTSEGEKATKSIIGDSKTIAKSTISNSKATSKSTISNSKATSKSTTSKPAKTSISTGGDSTSIPIEGDSSSKSPNDHAITIGEIEI